MGSTASLPECGIWYWSLEMHLREVWIIELLRQCLNFTSSFFMGLMPVYHSVFNVKVLVLSIRRWPYSRGIFCDCETFIFSKVRCQLYASLPQCGIWYWWLDTAAGDTKAWEAWGHGDKAHTLSWFILTFSILGKFCYIRVVEFLHVKSAVKCFVVGHLNLNSRLWPVKNWQYIE